MIRMKRITFASSTTIATAFILLFLALVFDIVWLKWLAGGYLVFIAALLIVPLLLILLVVWILMRKMKRMQRSFSFGSNPSQDERNYDKDKHTPLKDRTIIDAKYKVKE
jgi:amino acid permease